MRIDSKVVLLGLLATGAFLLGTYGFQQANPNYSVLTAMLAALQLFALNSGTVDSPVPWSLEVARWSALAFSGGAVFGLIRSLANDSVIRFWLLIMRTPIGRLQRQPFCVVLGLGRKGMSLVHDLRARKSPRYRVLGIDNDPDRVALARAAGIDGIVADATSEETLRLLPWCRLSWVVLLIGRDEPNLTSALNILRTRGVEKSEIALHVPTLALRNLIYRQNALKQKGVRMFNYYERLARQTLLRYPVEALGLASGNKNYRECLQLGLQSVSTAQEQVPHVFIRPSGDFTPALVYLLARNAHFPITARRPWRRIKILLVDADAEQQRAALQELYPALRRSGDGALVDLEVIIPTAGESAAQTIAVRAMSLPAGTPVTVFLDIHDAGKALIEALTFLDGVGLTGQPGLPPTASDFRCIFDYAEEPAIRDFIHAHESFESRVLPLPSMADCCGAMVLSEADDWLDKVARTMHARWDKEGKQPWESLTLELQESNRAAADHVGVLLRHLGKPAQEEVLAPGFMWGVDDLELLSECEHRRWSAQKLMDGWLADPTLGEGQDKLRKRHGCIDRPYTVLSEDMKERDRGNIRGIPELIRLLKEPPSGPL